MAYDMTFKRTPTASNVIASQELAQAYAKAVVDRIREAARGLNELAANPAASPDDVIAAVGRWTGALDGIKDGNFELLGAAVLGGATVTRAARTGAGIRPTTLSEHLLAHSVARFRGRELARDKENRWMALEMPTRAPDQQVSAPDPASFGPVRPNGAVTSGRDSVADNRSFGSVPPHRAEALTGTKFSSLSEEAELDALAAAELGQTPAEVEARRRGVPLEQVLAEYAARGE